ncbi:MAG: S-layer homology domain-containing protein, partial [Clostridiales Family XIII bacterium]|nr:S-layer homology domain-containing protein [Clostridiales Family XIII bacterium]
GSLWPDVTEAGVNDAAITAARRDGAGRPVYPLAFDTRLLGESAETFTVLDGDDTIYRGGPHAYGFVNDSLHKDSQISIVHTVDNWAPIDDPNLYLYLTGRDHALTVNDQVFSVSWNGETQTFQILEGSRYKVAIDPAIANGSLRVDRAEAAAGESVTVTVEPAAGRRFVSGSLKADGEPLPTAYGVASFAMPARDVTLTAAFAPLPAQEAQYDVEIAEDIAHGAVTTDVARGFDGQKVTVTATPETGYRLKAGSLKANGTAASLAADGARFFLISGADVTVTAEFESLAVTAPSGSKFKTGAAAKDFVLRIPADFALYDAEEGVTLNGEALPRSAYKAEEGSTVVTIFASHLSALPKGDYAVRVPFTDGSAVERGFSVMDVLVYDIGIGSLSGGFLSADKSKAEAGELVTVTATPQAGFRLVAGSLKWDGRAINTDASGGYAFTMPDWDVTLTAEFIESEAPVEDPLKGSGDVSAWVWDGKSIDLTWFDPEASSYHIKTPAQLAGLAALVNGLYNREIDTIAGDASYIRVNTGLGDENGPQGNNKSTATFHYGAYNFAGKTVYLDNDIDMGDANYMPIGGQYLMTKNKSETHIDASFNGVFDGRGHSVTINVDRHVSTGNYGDGQSVGLIGRLGVHDNDDASLRPEGAAVKNVAVYGSVRANRSVGGVVGKIGKTNGGAVIENCANFAAISSTDAKGVGGIVGAAWNGGSIKNCYNAGTVNGTHTNPAGGVAGSVEIPIENSYSYGRVTAPSGYAMAIGTNNGGAPAPENSYYLAGSAKDGGWYTGASADNAGERTAEYMKSDEFVSLLGGAFVKDTNKINNGYPVLKWQGGEAVAPPPVVEEGAKPSVNVPATTTVKDSEAVTVVEIPDAETPLANGEAVRLVVNVDTKGETVNKVKAELPAEFVKQAKESKSEVEIRSEVANMLLPEKAVAALGAEGKKVEVKAEKNEEAGTYAFTVASGGKSLTSVDGGIKAAIPVKAEEAKPGTVAVLVREDGTEEVIKKSFAKEGTLHAPLAGSATIKIVDNAKSYDDVAESAWYGDAVKFATGHELFKGTGETAFAPDASMTRGMLVTVLHRLEDEPSAAGAEAFGDVGEGKYYAAAVRWAAESGVVTGMGEGIFAPNAEITREQLAVILYRYAGALGLDASAKGEVSAYMDAKDVSPWAEEAMLWAAGAGLIAGRANPVGTELAPKDTATRAEVAAMLERFIENML